MNPTKLLVTRYGGAGDMIMMEPVLEALFYKYAPAELYLRTHPHYADLHRFHPLLKIIQGVLTENASMPGFKSDEKKPQGFDRFYNTTGCVEMNRGIHGIDSFALSTSAVPFRRTPLNIIRRFGERTPVALIMPSVWRNMKAGGVARDMAIARVTLGSGAATMAAGWAVDGKITGGG